MEFLSQAYMPELMRRVNADPVFTDVKKSGRNATYTLHFEREPDRNVMQDLSVGFEVIDVKISETWTGEDRTTEFTDLVFSGKYGVWIDLLQGRMKLTDALLARKLTLRGETNEITDRLFGCLPGPCSG